MGDHDDGVALCVDAFELFHDGFGGVRVEVAGRLVSEDNLGVANDGASDCYTLLLATGKLVGKIVFALIEVETLEGVTSIL